MGNKTTGPFHINKLPSAGIPELKRVAERMNKRLQPKIISPMIPTLITRCTPESSGTSICQHTYICSMLQVSVNTLIYVQCYILNCCFNCTINSILEIKAHIKMNLAIMITII